MYNYLRNVRLSVRCLKSLPMESTTTPVVTRVAQDPNVGPPTFPRTRRKTKQLPYILFQYYQGLQAVLSSFPLGSSNFICGKAVFELLLHRVLIMPQEQECQRRRRTPNEQQINSTKRTLHTVFIVHIIMIIILLAHAYNMPRRCDSVMHRPTTTSLRTLPCDASGPETRMH